MIAALTFVAAGIAAWLHYELAGRIVISGTGFTVWRAWYLAVLLAAMIDVLRLRDKELRAAWVVLALSYVASFMTWDLSARPLVDNALRMIIVMAALLFVCFRIETRLAAIFHGLVIFFAYLAYSGVIPSSGQRPRAFLAWSYPDIAAGLQHVSLVILGGVTVARSALLGWSSRRGHVADVGSSPVLQKAQG